MENIWGKKKKNFFLESSKKQKLNLLFGNYLYSIYTVLGIWSNLELI